jgi:hypothetical protein
MNIISTHIVPTKPRKISNLNFKQLALMALLSKNFRNAYLPAIRKLKTEKNLSNYLNSLTWSMFKRNPVEHRPRFYNTNTGRLLIGPTKAYNSARKLDKSGSIFSTNRTRNLSRRMNQRNQVLSNIKIAPKRLISKGGNGRRTNITFKTLTNDKVYTWGSNKTLNGLNVGVPYRNVKLRNIFTKRNRKMMK